ncbi:MAG: hypothetical protein L0H84_18135 [Pseudonocardia sp.]|nr:hypothetical protein [Pseudonocardia sp.]
MVRVALACAAGLAAASPLTHAEALELDRLSAHLIVLGGDYVGCEPAQAYRPLRCRGHHDRAGRG